MGQSSDKTIERKSEDQLKQDLDEKFKNTMYKKKVKQEEEKNQLNKIIKKEENDKDLQSLEKFLEKKEHLQEKNNSINNEECKEEEQKENEISEEESLEIKLNSIKSKADNFLEGKMNNIYEKFRYTLEVNNYINDEIEYIKKNNPSNLLQPNEAISEKNYIIRFLGYLASEFSLYRIRAFIEKRKTNEIIRDISFKMILSGLATQRIYKIILQNPENKKKFKEDIQLWYNFNSKIKTKLAIFLKIDYKEIYFFNYDTTNFEVNMIIYNQRFNGVEVFLKSYNVKVITSNLLNNIIFSKYMFLTKFCKNKDEWPEKDDDDDNLYRGGLKYHPPYGWKGFALKLRNKFGEDEGWLGKTGKKGKEWCVAYHGIGKGDEFKKVLSILNTNLRQGPKQRYSTYMNKRQATSKQYRRCGKGVYVTPDISKAETYAHKTKIGNLNKEFQFAVMVRCDPTKIRDPGVFPVNWVLNTEEIRPYRLLVQTK